MAMKQRELKEKMPGVAAFVELLVEAFGKEAIHGQIRRGLVGEPTFWASENGYEIGTKIDGGARWRVTWDPVIGCAVSVEINGKDGND
jgi:hypothetical protein